MSNQDTNKQLSSNPPSGAVTSHDTETAPEQKPIKAGHGLTAVLVLVVVLIVLGVLGILPRRHAQEVLAQRTNELAAPSVITLSPKPGNPIQELVLPGNVTSYTDAPIYARTSGYLTHWYFDIGAKVKQGALLAEISSPEVDQQLSQAQADLNTAEANANNARIQADRYKDLVKSNSVSQQDTDTFVNQAASTSAQVKSAQANVQRLKELTSFEKVYAPFDGRALSHASRQHLARLHQLARYLFRLCSQGRNHRSHLRRASRPGLPRKARSHRRRHRSRQPHPAR